MNHELVDGKGFRLLTARLIGIQDYLPESLADATGVAIEYSDALEQILQQDDGRLETFLKLDLHLDVANVMEIFAMDIDYVLSHVEGMNTDGVDVNIELDYWLVDNDTVTAEINREKLEESLSLLDIRRTETRDRINFVLELASAHLYDNCLNFNQGMHECLQQQGE